MERKASADTSPSAPPIQSQAAAMHEEQLRRLADRSDTVVYKPTYASVHEPWKATDARRVAEYIASKTSSFGEETSDFALRKALLEEEEVLKFQRCHPKLYYMLTDRQMVGEPRFRQALGAMLSVRDKVDEGSVGEDEANAMATSGVLAALQK